jgi:fluoride exporter
MIINILLVAIGGAFGSSSRYILGEFVVNYFRGMSFPLSTIIVNILGSFLAGMLHFYFTNYFEHINPAARLILMTGFLGGFTTFSTFSLDIFRLISAGQFNLAISYSLLSVILSIIAIFVGFYFASLVS